MCFYSFIFLHKMNILNDAIRTYSVPSSQLDTIQLMRSRLHDALSGIQFTTDSTVIVSDPGEESDDALMLRYILLRILGGPLYVILSGGLLNPDERLAHLKRLFPEFQDAEFGIPFGNITFLRDGEVFTHQVNCFVNCGPCHSITLESIFERLNESKVAGNNARMITVGANADGTAAGVNQKQTDDGVLKAMNWNEYLVRLNGVTITNLDVAVSRYVLLPHPSQIEGDYGQMPATCFDDIVFTTCMFFASRPSPNSPVALRVNEGNSIVVSQMIDVMSYQTRTNEFDYGLKLIDNYAAQSPTYQIAVSAAIPLMATALMGGVYKYDMYGFSPTDKTARVNVSCLTPESASVFISNIRQLDKFTPGYDLLAVILATQ
jgi:hypothetical protein